MPRFKPLTSRINPLDRCRYNRLLGKGITVPLVFEPRSCTTCFCTLWKISVRNLKREAAECTLYEMSLALKGHVTELRKEIDTSGDLEHKQKIWIASQAKKVERTELIHESYMEEEKWSENEKKRSRKMNGPAIIKTGARDLIHVPPTFLSLLFTVIGLKGYCYSRHRSQ